MKDTKRVEMGRVARKFIVDTHTVPVIGKQLEEFFDSLPDVDYDYDMNRDAQNPDAKIPDIADDREWIRSLYSNILLREIPEAHSDINFWIDKIQNGESRNKIETYFRKSASKKIKKPLEKHFSEDLGKDDAGKRIIVVMPQAIGDLYIVSSTFKSLKEQYPWATLYVAVIPKYRPVLEGNPYVDCILDYVPEMSNQLLLEGAGEESSYFEISFLPYVSTQIRLNYIHKGKSNIAHDLKL